MQARRDETRSGFRAKTARKTPRIEKNGPVRAESAPPTASMWPAGHGDPGDKTRVDVDHSIR